MGSTHSTESENTFKFEDHVYGILLRKKLVISMPNNTIGIPSVTKEFTIVLSKNEEKVIMSKKINLDGSTAFTVDSTVDAASMKFISDWIIGVQGHPTQLKGIRQLEAGRIGDLMGSHVFECFEHLFERKEFEGMDDILVGVNPQTLSRL